MKTRTQPKRLLSILLVLCLTLALLSTTAFAADTVYQVKGTETADFIEGIISGKEVDTDGNAYTGIKFPSGEYSYKSSNSIQIVRDFTMEMDDGADVVFSGQYFSFPKTSGPITVTFKGNGAVTMQEGRYGIWTNSNALTLNVESCSFYVKNTTGFGFYKLGAGSGTKVNISGAKFEMINCGNSGDEGGFEFDGGQLSITNGAKVKLEANGKTSFGDLYYNGTEPLTVSGKGTELTINTTKVASGYGMVLPGTGTMIIDDNAVVSIDQSAGTRGINAGSNEKNTITIKNSGELHIRGTEGLNSLKMSGIRRCNVSVVDNGVLSVDGFLYALDGSILNAGANSIVTLNGKTKDVGTSPVTGSSKNGATITGGSVLATPEASVVNGVLTSTEKDLLAPTPKNAAGETLTRFDLTGCTSPIKISTAAGDYDYKVEKDHNGTAYVWAPAVKVSFWTDESKTTGVDATTKADANGEKNSFQVISGSGLPLVGATAPTAPAGEAGKVPCWTMDGTNPVDLKTAVFKEDTDLYPIYIEPVTPPDLNSNDHIKYVVGYKDGTVKPEANISRSEVTTMFYRLLTAERRDAIFTSNNNFSDVTSNLWYNKAVSSMAKGGYVQGYTDGSFGGNRSISRAEFVAIAARFMDAKSGNVTFSDVSTNHWAYKYISTAVSYGWINGYKDGTFKPDQSITRAETMAIINRMLNRGVDANGVMVGFKAWSDNANAGTWYYYDVIEATNDHEYTGSRPSEKWTRLATDYQYDIVKYEHP